MSRAGPGRSSDFTIHDGHVTEMYESICSSGGLSPDVEPKPRVPIGDVMSQFPAMEVRRKDGKESFVGLEPKRTLQDFWAWAFSDLVGNTERGKLAEYIVATAIGCHMETSPTWESFDLLSPEGIRIEVKTSAYIQSWAQKKFSTITFNIPQTRYWDGTAYAEEKKRQADVYVFCVLKHRDQKTINPLDLSQWAFYAVATEKLDKTFGDQKTVCLNRLTALCNVMPCDYAALRNAVRAAVE